MVEFHVRLHAFYHSITAVAPVYLGDACSEHSNEQLHSHLMPNHMNRAQMWDGQWVGDSPGCKPIIMIWVF